MKYVYLIILYNLIFSFHFERAEIAFTYHKFSRKNKFPSCFGAVSEEKGYNYRFGTQLENKFTISNIPFENKLTYTLVHFRGKEIFYKDSSFKEINEIIPLQRYEIYLSYQSSVFFAPFLRPGIGFTLIPYKYPIGIGHYSTLLFSSSIRTNLSNKFFLSFHFNDFYSPLLFVPLGFGAGSDWKYFKLWSGLSKDSLYFSTALTYKKFSFKMEGLTDLKIDKKNRVSIGFGIEKIF